ncbi:MAG: DUF6084 family protein [Acidobacteriota bacterium]
MPDLSFQVEGAEAVPFTAAPLLSFRLRLSNADAGEAIQSVALRCQIQIEATRRKYKPTEQKRLLDLFGEPDRWSRTLRAMLWTHATVIVTPFRETTVVDLPVPCTFDFNVAAAKYFAALEDGEVPLNLMFSGTVFYESAEGALQVEQISWDKEAKYRLPVSVWKEMMDIYYPNMAWLCLQRDVFDRLAQYKMERGIPTWEAALERLLDDQVNASTDELEKGALDSSINVLSS